MPEFFLEYPLQDGYVHNWLVAGPLEISIPQPSQPIDDELRLELARQHHQRASDIHESPIEFGSFQIGDSEQTWRYAKCFDDHLLDRTTNHATPTYLRSWAYCQLVVPSDCESALALITYGPADVWANRAHVHRDEGFSQDGQTVSVPVKLQTGANELLVRFEQVTPPTKSSAGEYPYAFALRLAGDDPQAVTVKLPVNHPNVTRRQKLERLYAQAHVERAIVLRSQNTALHWDEVLDDSDDISFWVQDSREHIQVSGTWETKPGERLEIGHSQLSLDEGPYELALLPPPWVIERNQIVYSERLPFHVLETAYCDAYYGTYEERRREALAYALRREGVYAEIAKLREGQWSNVDADLLQKAIAQIDACEDGSEELLVGLLGALCRYPKTLRWLPKVQRSLEQCALGYKYWHDEPGAATVWYTSESQSILLHTSEILAGQLYPEQIFPNAGQSGEWHQRKGERLAKNWLRQRCAAGFQEWDSNETFAQDLLALSHLADLAEDVTVRELAAVMMDKLLFAIAVNSYRGVFGSTHGRTEAQMIAGGQLEPTSPITRLMWGMGVWNHHIRAMVSLACSEYEVPPLIPAIAADLDQELWAHEHHGGDTEQGVNKVTYRTADYMLCSAQDYRPGERGDREHVWQATLGPNAVVFVNHPACMSQEAARRPNFWRGNGILPRVAQWKDVLVSVHRFPKEGKPGEMGFTHAYWPRYEFDECAFEENDQGVRWAFARQGSGYIALAAAQGFETIQRGLGAYRELRSHGRQNTWLCLMGREATDGSFAEFREAVLALDVEFQTPASQQHTLGVCCNTLRGDTLCFGWDGPLLVNNEEKALSSYRHYDSAYCVTELGAREMDIRYGDYTMRLEFE